MYIVTVTLIHYNVHTCKTHTHTVKVNPLMLKKRTYFCPSVTIPAEQVKIFPDFWKIRGFESQATTVTSTEMP